MEENSNNGNNTNNTNNTNKALYAIIVVLIIIIVGGACFILGQKSTEKDDNKVNETVNKNEILNTEEKKSNENTNEQTNNQETITPETTNVVNMEVTVGSYKAKYGYDKDNKKDMYEYLVLRSDGTYTYGNDYYSGGRTVGTYKVNGNKLILSAAVAYGSDACYYKDAKSKEYSDYIRNYELTIVDKNTVEINQEDKKLTYKYDSKLKESKVDAARYVTNPVDGKTPSKDDDPWTDCTDGKNNTSYEDYTKYYCFLDLCDEDENTLKHYYEEELKTNENTKNRIISGYKYSDAVFEVKNGQVYISKYDDDTKKTYDYIYTLKNVKSIKVDFSVEVGYEIYMLDNNGTLYYTDFDIYTETYEARFGKYKLRGDSNGVIADNVIRFSLENECGEYVCETKVYTITKK